MGGRGLCITSLPSGKDTSASVYGGGLKPSLRLFFLVSLPIPLRALKPRPKHKLTVPKEAHLGLTPGSPPANTTRPSGTGAGCRRGGTSALRVSSGALYPHLQHFKARSSGGKDGAPGRIFPRRLLTLPPAPVYPPSPHGPIVSCTRTSVPFLALGFIATASAPLRPPRSSRREMRKRKPLGPPSASPPHAFGPGSDPASPAPSMECSEAPPPPSPLHPLRTKKAAGNPGLAGVQVISCFLMGSNFG